MATLASMTVDLNMDSSGVVTGARTASAAVQRMTVSVRRTTERGMQEVAHNMDGQLRDMRGNLVRSGRQRGMDFSRSMVRGVSRGLRNAGSAFTGALTGSFDQVRSAMQSSPYAASIGTALALGVVATALPLIGAIISGAVISVGGLGVIGIAAALTKSEPEVKKAAGKLKSTVGKILKGAAKPLAPAFADAMDKATKTVKGLKPTIEKMFRSVKPSIPKLADGILGGAEKAIKGFTDTVSRSQPVMNKLAGLFNDVGSALGSFFRILGQNPQASAAAIGDLGKIIKGVILIAAYFIAALTRTYGQVRSFIVGVIHFFEWLYDVLVGHSIIPDLVKAIAQWFMSLPGRILGALSSFVHSVVAKFAALAARAIVAVQKFISGTVAFFKALPGRAAGAIASLASRVYAKVYGAGQRMLSAARKGVSSAVSAVRKLPGQAARALGGIGSRLYSAGRSLVSGFIRGITGMFGAVRSRLSHLTSMLPSWKGPESLDKRILTPAGKSVIGGFMDGIQAQVPSLRKQLTGITNDLPGMGVDISPRGVFRTKQAQTTHVVLDVNGTDSDVVKMVKKWVRTQGGNNVQSLRGA